MTNLIYLIETTAPGLYILIGIAIFWNWWRWRGSRRWSRTSQFELERDLARFRGANALTAIFLLIEAGLLVNGIQMVVAPTLRNVTETTVVAETFITDVNFATPTLPPLVVRDIDESGVNLGGNVNPASQIRITPTPTFTPVGTILPNFPTPTDCQTENAQLVKPANGMLVHEIIDVVGIAKADNFSSYKIEISGPSTNNVFATRESVTRPVPETGNLTTFVPTEYAEGRYQFRLAVFDNTFTMVASCTVTIEISRPIPTATPIGQ